MLYRHTHNTTTMRRIFLTLALASATFLCFGQERHLEPVRDFGQHDGVLREYYDGLFALLYGGYSGKPVARYTSMPSFTGAYSFSVETIRRKKYVVSNRLSGSYWYAKNRRKVKLISSKTELSDDLYLKIIDLFKTLEEQTKKQGSYLIAETSADTAGQKRVVVGTVVDSFGKPVVGANVYEKGTTKGVATDINGKFSFYAGENAVLKVSYIGYSTLEFAAENRSNVKIIMLEDMQGLDGVTYYFATTDENGQVKIGETWSPADDSLLGKVVKICDTIHSLGSGNVSQSEIAKDIDELLNIQLKEL